MKRLSHYTILEQIGAGGMGVVYRARDDRLARDVAVKILPPSDLPDPRARRQFQREALALSRLNHPNIAIVHDFDSADGIDFLVMEYIAGQSLSELVKERRLSESEVRHIGIQLAEGLAAAHQHHVVHRDLKPGNLRLTPDGRLKILDFGLARFRQVADGDALSTTVSGTTGFEVAGTLPYMAPEQLRDGLSDELSDIYSVGVVLYELLSGRLPFQGSTRIQLAQSILNESPPLLSSLLPMVSTDFEEMIEQAMEKDRSRRIPSALVLKSRLESLGGARIWRNPLSGRKLPTGAARVLSWATVGTVVALGAVAAMSYWPRHRVSLAVLPFTNATADSTIDYLCEGLPDKLISTLSGLDNIGKVTARASAFSYQDPDTDPRRVSRELGVEMILTGRITGTREQPILETNLVSKDGRLVWNRQTPILMDDVTAMENDLTGQIVAGLRIPLTTHDQEDLARSPEADHEAHLLVLKARYYLRKFSEATTLRARDLCRQALDLNPAYAPAHTALAETYFNMSNHTLPASEAMPRVKAAAMRAIELDPHDADAHVLLGVVMSRYEWDWKGGEQMFRKAIQMDPNSVLGQQYLGFNLIILGKVEEARSHLELASTLDPLSTSMRVSYTMPLYYAPRFRRDHKQAVKELTPILADDSTFVSSYIAIGVNLLEMGQVDSARRLFARARRLEDIPFLDTAIAIADARAGRKELAEAEAETLEARVAQRFVPALHFAYIYTALGRKDIAMKWLGKAEAAHDEDLVNAAVDPLYDPLRNDPQFIAFLKRMKLDRI